MAADEVQVDRSMVLLGDDSGLSNRLGRLADEFALMLIPPEDVPEGSAGPKVAVLDLDRADALTVSQQWHERWPETLMAGYSAIPDRELWVAAQRAGCDMVVNRGSLVLRLTERLRAAPGGRVLRRFPLFDVADAAGRLGCVFRAEETPVGPLAVYRVDGRLCAVADRCPHAGGVLSTGEVEGVVVTCPEHGSQFDVCTGERVRGPADMEVATFGLVQDAGQVFVVLPG